MKAKHLTIVLPCLCLLVGCQSKEHQTESPLPVPVKVSTVEEGGLAMQKHYSGTVEEENGTPLSFSTAGTVQALHFHVGQQVAKGQLLATLDPTSMQNTYNAARATLEQAQDAYRRMKELHDKGSLPDIKWVEVRSKLEQAVSMEQLASKNLKDCKLYAPYSGVIARKEVETGQNVMPGVPVAQLVTASVLRIKVAVPETEISSVKVGQEAAVRVSALEGSIYKATVVEKGIVANPLSRSYDVKLKVEGSHMELLPGMVADVSIRLAGNGADSHCVIPACIVQLDEKNKTFVWTVKGGKAHKQEIVCGEYRADGVTVLSGLSPNDRIITEGQQKVCEGTEVAL